jgi:type III secretion system FlhB-like substrate exporter
MELLKDWDASDIGSFTAVIGVGLNKDSAKPIISLEYQNENLQEILRLAKQFGVPVIKNAPLLDLLDNLEIDEIIADDLYWVIMVLIREIDKMSISSR